MAPEHEAGYWAEARSLDGVMDCVPGQQLVRVSQMMSFDGTYYFAVLAFQRGLAVVYAMAFMVAYQQFPTLQGSHGFEPTVHHLGRAGFWKAPSLFYFHYSDVWFRVVAGCGVTLALAVVGGLGDVVPVWAAMLLWLILWVLYLSIKNIGGTFYGFGWESMLLDAGFLAIFLGHAAIRTPLVLVMLLRWLLFRVELGAGLIKMRGDPCWRDLSCMRYHHETQPIPNRLSWYFHHAPLWWHKLETLGNHVVQLGIVWLIFGPQPLAAGAGGIIVLTQVWLMQSGNYSWLNFLTICVAFSTIHDAPLVHYLGWEVPPLAPPPSWFVAMSYAATLLIAALSIPVVRNLFSQQQRMNVSFNPFHIGGSYGAFGSVTRERHEVIIEGTLDEDPHENASWEEYELKAKPGDVARPPRQLAPYHLRLDWQLWFVPFRPTRQPRWLLVLVQKLLENDRACLALFGRNPFEEAPPRFLRISLYHYRYTTWRERRATRAYWVRTYLDEYLPPVDLSQIRRVLSQF